ncbi:MAG: C2H2-type zinc finger protein [Clostridia bacterium]|jgi:uncharacterized protein YbaR (Trm112 family)
MNYHGYELENGQVCKCGYEFKINDITKLQRVGETLYGGTVRHLSKTNCPCCNRETLLLLKQQGQTYVIKGIMQKELSKIDNSTNTSTKEVTEEPRINSEESETISNEFICPVCKRIFKNKSGLTNHMKVH